MAVKWILTQGIGFNPGSTRYIPPLGFLATVPAPVAAMSPFRAVPWYPIWGRLQHSSATFAMRSSLTARGSILREGAVMLWMVGNLEAKPQRITMASILIIAATKAQATGIQRLSLAKLRQQEYEVLI